MPSRQELFDELVRSAVRDHEVVSGLEKSPGIDAEYLRDRCEQVRDQCWLDVAESAKEYDTAADSLRMLQQTPRPLLFLYWAVSSSRLHITVVCVGLLSIMAAWVFFDAKSMSAFPSGFLLVMAVALVLVGLVNTHWPQLFRRALPRRAGTLKLMVEIVGTPVACLAGIELVYLAVGRPVAMDSVSGATTWNPLAAAAIGVMLGFFVAVPFLRAAVRGGTARVAGGAALIVPLLGAALLAVTVLVALSGAEDAVVIGEPNDVLLLSGLWLLLGATIVAFLGFAAKPAGAMRDRYRHAARELSDRLTSVAIMPFLRAEINNHTQVPDVEIDVREAPGLGQLSDPMYKVPTAAAEKVAKLIESMPGGSIGLAGPRGAGKTTLIEAYCGERRPAGTLATMVSAPVEYASREFLLHLYAKVCREVAGPEGSRAPGLESGHASRARRRMAVLLCAFLTFVSGIVVMFAFEIGLLLSAQQAWALLLMSLGVIVMVVVGVDFLRSAEAVRVSARRRELADVAKERLEEIRFQQSFSSTWSGAVKVPLGVEAMVGGGRGLTRQPLHLPEIVDSLREFLELAAREHRVIIGIDELDKMESETAAEQFLNEIKSIFGVRGCYFLVSVSEDAMSSFERRGLPFRDVFDSTFDEIVWFEHLTGEEAVASIDRRVLLMPVPFKQLCFALSGGLPRDLIRVARLVLDAQDPTGATGLSRIAARLVEQEVVRKSRAIAVAARRIDLEPDVSRFLLVCARVTDTGLDPARLLRLVEEILPARGTRARLESTTPAGGAFLKLASELACFYYYAATVLDYFDESAPADRWRDSAALHHLAGARQAFSTSTRVAWEGISTFRSAWTPATTAFPAALEPVPDESRVAWSRP